MDDVFTAITPFGVVEVGFPEDGGSTFDGPELAVQHVLDTLSLATNAMGMTMTQSSLEPNDFLAFGQPEGSGVKIIAPEGFERDLGEVDGDAQDGEALVVLDAVSDDLRSARDRLDAARSPLERLRAASEVTRLLSLVPAPGELVATSTRRVRGDPMDGSWIEVTLSDGRVYEMQRLNATESMGLAGWHQRDRVGMQPSRSHSYLGDTQPEAIRDLIERAKRDAPAAVEPTEPVTPASVVLATPPPAGQGMTLDQVLERDRALVAMGMQPDEDYIRRTYGEGWKFTGQKRATVLDDASMNSLESTRQPDGTALALAAVVGRLATVAEDQNKAIAAAISERRAPVEVRLTADIKSEPVKVDVNMAPLQVDVKLDQAPMNVTVQMPEQPAPVVHVTNEVQPATVAVDVTALIPPRTTTTVVERDGNGDISRTVQTEVEAS